MASYKHTRRRHGVFHKKRRVTKRLKNTLRKSRGRVMRGGVKITYADGRITYDGDIKDGKPHDEHGEMVWANGAVYVGGFKDGVKDGEGKMTWSSGEVYEGNHRDGMKNGKGTYSCTDGSVYVGEWLDDKKNGRGKMRFLNGAIYDGNWENDEMQTFTPLLQDGGVSKLAFHPSEPLLLSLCRSKNRGEPPRNLFLQRFDRNTGHIIDNIHIQSNSPVRSIAFHPKAPIFVVCHGNGMLHLLKWNIDLSEGLSVLQTSTTQLGSDTQCELIAFHPSGPLLATCGKSPSGISTVRLWRIKKVESTKLFYLEDLNCEMRSNEIASIAFHPTKPILITACGSITENTVKLWNYFDYNPSGVSPNLMTILSSLPSVENNIRTAFNSDHTSFHSDFVTCVVFHPTEPLFITGSKDTTIKMWRMTPKPLAEGQGLWQQLMNATCVSTFRSDDNVYPVTSIAFHPTAPLLVGGYHNGNAILWSYIGFLTNKVLTIDPMMYEEYGLGVFPPPPPPVSGVTSVTSVTSVNFQVDSRGVTFLEIGRSNTNIVELQNVGHFVSSAENTARERNEQFETRRELVQKLSNTRMLRSFRDGQNRFFTPRDMCQSIQRRPVLSRSGVTIVHDKDWHDTQESRSQQGPPLQVELDSETREAIKFGEDSDDWSQRYDEQFQQIKRQQEPSPPPLPESLPESLPEPSPLLQSTNGGNRRQTTRKNRRNK